MLDRSYANLTLDQLQQIDAAFAALDAELTSVGTLDVARARDCLASVPEQLRPPLFREIIEADLVRHEDRGDEIDPQQYLDLFPDYHDTTLEVFAAWQSRELSDGDSSSSQPAGGEDRSLNQVGSALLGSILRKSDAPNCVGRIGNYVVRSIIGVGGMGVVVDAWDTQLSRQVAIKVLSQHLTSSPRARTRFLQEARAAGSIRHPNVVGIYSVDDQHDPPLLVLEHIAGESLSEILENTNQLPISQIIEITTDVASGLAAAHDVGIVHRDLKPGNILIDTSVRRAHVSDFGLSQAVDNPELTAPGELLGTPRYMSPEQVEGQQIDHRSDLFSLGAVLYRMLTGTHAFAGRKPITLARQICDSTPTSIRHLRPDAPRWLCELTEQLLKKNRDDRPQSADEVIAILQAGPRTRTRRGPLRWFAQAGLGKKLVGLLIPVGAIAALVTLLEVTDTTNFFVANAPASSKGSEVAPLSKPGQASATDSVSDSSGAAASLAGPSAGSLTKVFTSDKWTWTKPEPFEVEILGKPTTPFISHDQLTFLFGDGKLPTDRLVQNIMICTRPAPDASWSSPVPLPGINDTDNTDLGPSMTADGLTLVFASKRDSGFGDLDLWIATRPRVDAEWNEPTNLGSQFNSSGAETHPTISPSGRSLAFVSNAMSEHGSSDISISTRDPLDATWSDPQVMPATVNSSEADRGPQLISDEAITFVRIDGSGRRWIYISERSAKSGQWSEASPIAPIPGIVLGGGIICPDGRTLIFQNYGQRSVGLHSSFGIVKRRPVQQTLAR